MLLELKKCNAWIPALLSGVLIFSGLCLQLPELMNHWDEFQLAYGVDNFDMTRHQPHPPGYYLFILAGRFTKLFVGDASLALQVVSAFSISCLFTILIWMLINQLGMERWSWLGFLAACVIFVFFSPLIMQYAVVGLTYATEGAIWSLFCIAVSKRPTGFKLCVLVVIMGIIGGFRQNLSIWAVLLCLIEWARHRDWMPLKRLPVMAALFLVGLILWIVPLFYEAGGYFAWREASDLLFVGNIWEKSLFHTGLQGLVRRQKMFLHLWLGLGPLLIIFPFLLLMRLKGLLKNLDAILAGAIIAFVFYGVFIYDTKGYMLAPVLTLGTWILLSCASLMANRRVGQQWICGLVIITMLFLFPKLPGIKERDGKNPYTVLKRNNALLKSRIAAVNDAVINGEISPENTVLLTSREYWLYSFRHVSYYLPGFTTVQLTIDQFFSITRLQTPYLMSRNHHLKTVGPNGVLLAKLLPAGLVKNVIYMVPHDFREFINPNCRFYVDFLKTSQNERLIYLKIPNHVTPQIKNQSLLCRKN